MSVLRNKQVLIIGDETLQVHDIETALKKEGAVISTTSCEETTSEMLEAEHIDVIFLNHLHEESHCVRLLKELQAQRDTKALPIFALVEDQPRKIEHVLSLGAADYFVTKETVQSIINKVRIVLGDPVNTAGDKVIDISESRVDTESDGIRVLIVEDDPLLANLLGLRLSKANFPFHVNKDGKAVLDDITSFKPDILILDLMLPGTSGFAVLEEIRKSKKHKNLPVFIFSNRDGEDDKVQAEALSVQGFFVKAMTDLSDLVTSIEKQVKTVDD